MELEVLKECLKDGWKEGEPYVFISYASKDKEKVYRFVYELRKRGINVYIDLELQENIAANWLENIKNRLYDVDCKAMISFLSIDYLRSYACLMEQLMTRSEDLKEEKGKFMDNFYISLDDGMGSMQGIEKTIYEVHVTKESQKEIVKMVPEEVQILKRVIESNCAKENEIKKMLEKVDAFKTKHSVAVFMFHYVFKGQSFSIQPYDTAEKCAELLYRNCINEKNSTINIFPLKELEEKYRNLSLKFYGQEQEKTNAQEVKPTKKEEHTDTEEKRQKISTTTGDVTFTLYDKTYTSNQADMMLTFFAHVLKNHPEMIKEVSQYQGMNCVSDINYTLEENRGSQMPTYFRSCKFFVFPNGEKLCVGTSYSLVDKLKKMAILLEICGENPSIFTSSQVVLPKAKAIKIDENSEKIAKGKASLVKFSIFGQSYEQNQSDMLGTVCSELLNKHPDKLEEAANTLLCIDTKDYRYTPKEERPVYFSSMNYYEISGVPCSIGGSFGMKDKLKMIGKLLVICEEHMEVIQIDGYEIPSVNLKTSKNKVMDYFA